jgi:radical SAM superfamily enzyme YgiQ (UPF0313 family)
MKITFIRPNIMDMRSHDALAPLSFAVLAGLTPENIHLEFFDECLEKIPANLETDLAALSVTTFSAARSYRIADDLRARNIPVVMGGFHPTFRPDEALKHADCVVLGEAEDTWPKVIKDFQNGRLSKKYSSEKLPDLNGLRFRRDIYKGKKYNQITPVQFSRGCRYSCEFCSVSAFHGATHRCRPVSDVIRELEALKTRKIFFTDDNLYFDKIHLKQLCEALIPLKLNWACQISIDIARDLELVRLMAKSGCLMVTIGFESFNIRSLNRMNKHANINNIDYTSALNILQGNGIMVYGTFIFGYENDTVDDIKRALDFALSNKLSIANFNSLVPLPGTRLYCRLKKEGRLIRENWWIDKSFHFGDPIFRPLNMEPDELINECFKARKLFYSYGSITRRMFNFKSNMSCPLNFKLFLGANIISRREILIKHGKLMSGSSRETAGTSA